MSVQRTYDFLNQTGKCAHGPPLTAYSFDFVMHREQRQGLQNDPIWLQIHQVPGCGYQ